MKKLLLSLLLLPLLAQAQVEVKDAWIRATVPGAHSAGVFMALTSGRDAQLVAVRSGVAGAGEIHRMEMDGQLMKMRAVDVVELPAGQTVSLASGGYHIMLMDLKRQLKEGETVPLSLTVREKGKKTETVTVNAVVKPLTYSPAGVQAAAHQHQH